MAHRLNEGTPYMSWQLSSEPYASNVRVQQEYRGTVTVSVSNGGFGMRRELSPDEARGMAAALLDLAALAEAD